MPSSKPVKVDRCIRCALCGKPIVADETSFKVLSGERIGDGWRKKTVWGLLHERCFITQTRDTEGVMRLLREEAAK